MTQFVAAGLPGDWLNAWLAAIGIAVLCPEVQLGWSEDPLPKAVFDVPDGSLLAETIAARVPSLETLDGLVTAELGQKLTLHTFAAAAKKSRAARIEWLPFGGSDPSLAVLSTDLVTDEKNLKTGPFNLGAPRGETLFARARTCREHLGEREKIATRVGLSLTGRGSREKLNGLGFDYRRITASVPGEGEKFADPVIELLAFFGLLLHPVGAEGRELRQRGWSTERARRGSFRWPLWRPQLDIWGIDALLDLAYPTLRHLDVPMARLPADLERLGVHEVYGVVPFIGTGKSDPTRGYASERLG